MGTELTDTILARIDKMIGIAFLKLADWGVKVEEKQIN